MKSLSMNHVNGVSTVSAGNVVFGRGRLVATQIVNQRNPPKRPKNKNKKIRIGSWNVRTFNAEGKIENVIHEMQAAKVSILGVCETHWIGNEDFNIENYRIITSGGDSRKKWSGYHSEH